MQTSAASNRWFTQLIECSGFHHVEECGEAARDVEMFTVAPKKL
jgi:hypothetical protein